MGLKTLWKNYLRWTQAVVVAPLIVNAKLPWLKASWTMLLITTTMAFVVQSGYVVKAYYAYRTMTNIRLVYEPQAPFPAVTFCNLNPYKKSAIDHSQELKNLVASYTYVTKVKQVQMNRDTTTTEKTTTNRTESRARRKRQGAGGGQSECEGTTNTLIESSRFQSVWRCENGTAFEGREVCDVNNLLNTAPDYVTWQASMEIVFYPCFQQTCADSRCNLQKDQGDTLNAVFKNCDNPPQFGSSHSYNYTYSCTRELVEPNDYHLKCVQTIHCFPEPTTTESLSSPTTTEMTTTPPVSTLETTTTPLTSATELPNTSTGVLTSTTIEETHASDPMTTTDEPASTTSEPFPSETLTTTTATKTDADSTPSSISSSTPTSKATSSSAAVQKFTGTSTSQGTTTLTPLAPTTTTAEMSQGTTTLTPLASTTTTAERSQGTTTLTPLATTSTTIETPRRTTTLTPLVTTSITTETSYSPQVTTTLKPTNNEKTRPTTEKYAAVRTSRPSTTSTRAPLATTTMSQPSTTTVKEPPTAYVTTTEAQTTTTSPLLPSTTVPAAVSSTEATSPMQITTRTELATSSLPLNPTISVEHSSSVTRTSNSSPLPISTITPSETSKFSTTVATATSLTPSTLTIPSTWPAVHFSTYSSDVSTASTATDLSIMGTTSATEEPATASSSGHATTGTTATASADGEASSTTVKGSMHTAKHSSSTSTLSTTQRTESSPQGRSTAGRDEATSVTAATQFESAMTTVRGTVDPAETPVKAATHTSLASASPMPTRTSSSSDTRSSANVVTNAAARATTISTSDRSSRRSSTPSVVMPTLTGGTERRYSSTNRVKQGTSAATTDHVMQTSKVSQSLQSSPSSITTETAASTISESPSPLIGQYTRTRVAGENGVDQSTTLKPNEKSTTKGIDHVPGSKRREDFASNSPPSDAGVTQDRTSSPSAKWSTLKGSSKTKYSSPTPSETGASYSTVAQTEGNVSETTVDYGSDADDATSLGPVTTVTKATSHPSESSSPSHQPTETTLGGGNSGTTTSTTAEKGQGEQTSATRRGGDLNHQQSTSRSPLDAEQHDTTVSDSSVPTGISDIGNEHTTISYENYLKNIKLNLNLDFDLDTLTDDQLKNLKDLSHAYGLNPSNSQVLVDAYMKLALQTVAAKMSPALRQIVSFQLKDLVSSCIINGEPCDMVNDFKQTFDVDYGNCYTFNHGTPVKYITNRAGSAYGLRMTVISNSTESLPFSSEQGFKIVVHNQDLEPFPNAEGYKTAVGQAASMLLTRSKYSRLGEPYGKCSTRNSIAKNKQPFYYNGTYSTEGCFRSCFQRNIATACGCTDHRFPPPTHMDVPICDLLEPEKYKCMEEYIEKNGDYHFVNNCRCYNPCEDTAYRSYVFESPWPAGDFFYGGYCPMAKKMNVPCSEFYRNNGMKLEVSYAQLGYRTIEEEPLSTPWSLFNELAGNIGFWVGYTMLSFAEWILITVQVCLYTFGKELPEVPSLRDLDYSTEEEEESDGEELDSDDSSGEDAEEANSNSGAPGPSGSSDEPEGVCVMPSASSMRHRTPPKNFDNVIGDTALTRREVEAIMPTNEEFYDAKDYELVVPVIAQTNEHAVRDAQD